MYYASAGEQAAIDRITAKSFRMKINFTPTKTYPKMRKVSYCKGPGW
jgi:hypothetical protein